MATPLTYIPAPAGRPLQFGLLSAAVVDDQPDGPWEMGVQYEPDYCGPANVTEGACRTPDLGTATASVNNARVATTDVNGQPVATTNGDQYTLLWGDGQESDLSLGGSPDNRTHTYAADGSYVVTILGPDGYTAQGTITVTNGSTSGPFTLTVTHQNVPIEGINTVEGFPFAVYSLFNCKAVGGVWQLGADRARKILLGGEGRAVESVLAAQMAADNAANDLTPTPGTAVHPITGLSILEGWSSQFYGQAATIHSPRSLTTILGALGGVSREGLNLETKQGTRVASGAGYEGMDGPLGAAAGAGEAWMWVTGTVLLRRASTVRVDQTLAKNAIDNEMLARAVRPYTVSHECILGAVLVTTGYEVPV